MQQDNCQQMFSGLYTRKGHPGPKTEINV